MFTAWPYSYSTELDDLDYLNLIGHLCVGYIWIYAWVKQKNLDDLHSHTDITVEVTLLTIAYSRLFTRGATFSDVFNLPWAGYFHGCIVRDKARSLSILPLNRLLEEKPDFTPAFSNVRIMLNPSSSNLLASFLRRDRKITRALRKPVHITCAALQHRG